MLVLDANIFIRAVLGKRARFLIEKYARSVGFAAPDVSLVEAEKALKDLSYKRKLDVSATLKTLFTVSRLVEVMAEPLYSRCEADARERLARRDPGDWPILAAALALDCAIWTEDRDFFGTGVATWTSDRVEIYLRRPESAVR